MGNGAFYSEFPANLSHFQSDIHGEGTIAIDVRQIGTFKVT